MKIKLVSIMIMLIILISSITSMGSGMGERITQPLDFNPFPHSTPRTHYWGLCAHEHSDYNDDTFRLAEDLDVAYMRTDISWHNLDPENGVYDQEYIAHMTNIINSLKKSNIQLFAVPGHAPSWARSLYNSDETAFWGKLQEYHAKISKLWGDDIYYYQVENELNHPTRKPYFDKSDIPKYCKYAKAGIKEHDSEFKTVLNSLCENAGWSVEMEDWLNSGAKKYIDIIGLDMYPATWSDEASMWSPLRTTMSLVNLPGTSWYGKDIIIAECGYSTYDSSHNEQKQKNFINVAIKYLNDIVIDYNQEHPNNKVHMICWYELFDGKANSIDVEDNFGICLRDGTKKVGYESLKKEIAHYEDLTWFASFTDLPFMGLGLAVGVILLIIVLAYYYFFKKKGRKLRVKKRK